MTKKTAIILAIPVVILAAAPLAIPETPEDLQEAGYRSLDILSGFFGEVWEGFVGWLKQLWEWLKTLWHSFVDPIFQNIWLKVKSFFLAEYEARKPAIEQEIQQDKAKVKESVKSELLGELGSFWERIKSLVK